MFVAGRTTRAVGFDRPHAKSLRSRGPSMRLDALGVHALSRGDPSRLRLRASRPSARSTTISINPSVNFAVDRLSGSPSTPWAAAVISAFLAAGADAVRRLRPHLPSTFAHGFGVGFGDSRAGTKQPSVEGPKLAKSQAARSRRFSCCSEIDQCDVRLIGRATVMVRLAFASSVVRYRCLNNS